MSTTFLDQFVNPVVDVLTPEAAKRIAELRASPELQAELDDLADKANQGTLTEDERSNYDRFLAAYHFISILQARARKMLREEK